MDIDQLRQTLAHPLDHPNPDQVEELSALALRYLQNHFNTLAKQDIGQTASRPQMEAHLRQEIPAQGNPFAQVLSEFQEKVAPFAFRVNHPRFLAFIPGAPSFASFLGDILCAGTNFFCGVWLEGAGPTEVELVVLDWFKELLGFPADARGILTSGGSEANLTALVTAREPLPYTDRHRAVLYVTKQRHSSIDRAGKIMGLHPDQIRHVPCDVGFRMSVEALGRYVQSDRREGRLPWAVVANAGATNTGTVDPLAAIADLCSREKMWFHVDGAYGWPAVLVPEGKQALTGIERADSITLDPHKWFAQTFEAGCILVRDGKLLEKTFTTHADYLQDVRPADDEVNFCDHGIALTRRFRALKIWVSIKVLGMDWFRALVQRSMQLAELAEQLLRRRSDFEVLCNRQLSIVCFRHLGADPADLNRHNLLLVEKLRQSGRAFISSTLLGDRVALRLCFVNWRTTSADVEEVIGLLEKLGAHG